MVRVGPVGTLRGPCHRLPQDRGSVPGARAAGAGASLVRSGVHVQLRGIRRATVLVRYRRWRPFGRGQAAVWTGTVHEPRHAERDPTGGDPVIWRVLSQ